MSTLKASKARYYPEVDVDDFEAPISHRLISYLSEQEQSVTMFEILQEFEEGLLGSSSSYFFTC